jgi:hypothetical protein
MRLDVDAGTEVLAFAGQHCDPHLVGVGEAVEGTDQLVLELGVLCVDRRVDRRIVHVTRAMWSAICTRPFQVVYSIPPRGGE